MGIAIGPRHTPGHGPIEDRVRVAIALGFVVAIVAAYVWLVVTHL